MTKTNQVVVLFGAGSIGVSIIRRIAAGKTILLGDVNRTNLAKVQQELEDSGYQVKTQVVDATSAESIDAFASAADHLGEVVNYVHTAGLSPAQATAAAVLSVDLAGTAQALEAFGKVIAPGGSGLVVSSQAGYMLPSFDETTRLTLAQTPASELLALPALDSNHVPNSAAAYGISKLANQIRVQAESLKWGERGARINSVSPGIIITPLARQELASPAGAVYRQMIDASALKRVGSPDEVANAAAFLLSEDAAFITGSDLLLDGGVIAALKNRKFSLQ